MINKAEDLLNLGNMTGSTPSPASLSGAGSVVFANSQADVDVFRRQLDIEMGRATADTSADMNISQGPMAAIRSFGQNFIKAETAYKNSLDSILTQTFGQPVQTSRDYSVTSDGIQANSATSSYNSVMQSLGQVGPGAIGLPTGPGGAGWTGNSAHNSVAQSGAVSQYSSTNQVNNSGYQATPEPGTNEVAIDIENTGQLNSDPIRQTQQIMKDLTGDMWRITFTNMQVSSAMQKLGQYHAMSQAGTDIARGLVSALTKGS